MRYTLVCLLVVAASVHAPAALATDNEPPVVDAGLDQSVAIGATVYLDAGGSYDPDGEIVAYEWTIRGPNGTRTAPDCPTCERTSFVPDEPGRYAVTLMATDDDGARRTDTLYVEVRRGEGPTVTLSAPATTTRGDPANVTATVDAGAASLDRLRWVVDGVTVATTSLDGDTATVSRLLPTAGGGPLDVRVTAVDDAGLRASDEARIAVSDPGGGSGGGSGGGGGGTGGGNVSLPVSNETTGGGNNSTSSNGTAISMAVEGPDLITGERPLRATYSLAVGGDAELRSVGWYVDGRLVDGGTSATVTFDPGRHDLYARAITDDGSRTVTFRDGSTEVVADPPPTVTVESLTTEDLDLAGNASASDPYGMVTGLSVSVDGATVATASETPERVRLGLPTRRLSFSESLSANETYRVSVTTVDDRGQSTTVTRTVTSGDGQDNESASTAKDPNPTVISAEFVNGPVDSYDERLPEERYLAEHVTRIDLDGADPSAVGLMLLNEEGKVRHFNKKTEKRYDETSGILVIRSYFAATEPDNHPVYLSIDYNGVDNRFRSIFTVTPSKPEARLEVTRPGTEFSTQNMGMVIDATDSFDPDGTRLKYRWGKEAERYGSRGIGKMDSLGRANLTITDQRGLSTKIEGDFLNYFNPGLQTIELASTDQYTQGDQVYVRISTPVYGFTKPTYDAEISVSVVGGGRVVEWQNLERGSSEQGVDSPGNPKDANDQRYRGLVAIDRSEFDDGDPPKIRIYNEAKPELTAIVYPITASDLGGLDSVSRRDITIEDVRYEVASGREKVRVTSSPDQKAKLTERGYEVVEKRREPVRFELERRVTRWETTTERRTFNSQSDRSTFLRTTAADWRPAGTETVTEQRQVTETVWRDSHGGSGVFTGETKRVVESRSGWVREFQYVEEVTKTIEVTERVTIPTPSGETREILRTTEETVTRERTYWARSPKSPDHTATGESRRVIPNDSYKIKYKYQVERMKDVDVTRYVAERTVSTSETVWTDAGTMDGDSRARQRASANEDLRIVDTEIRTEWVLESDQNRTVVRDEYSDSDNVEKTIVYVSGELVNGDRGSAQNVSEFRERITFDGALSKEEVRNRLEGSDGDEACSEDDPIQSGCGVDE